MPNHVHLINVPQNDRWSRSHAHLTGADDDMTRVAPLLELVSDRDDFLRFSRPEEIDLMHRHERTAATTEFFESKTD